MDNVSPAPLVAYRDRTVSMIRAKYEARDAAKTNAAAFVDLVDVIARVAVPRLKGKRWLERHLVAEFERAFVDRYDTLPNLVSRKDEERRPTLAKPRSWAVFRSRLNAVPQERIVRLNTAFLFATRKEVVYATLQSPHSWDVHAQERLHQRSSTNVRADMEIARAIVDSVAVVTALCMLTEAGRFHGKVAVPCLGGLLLGEIAAVPSNLVLGRSIYCGQKDGCVRSLDFDDYRERLGSLGKGPGSGYALTGKTFVGPDEMRPSQFEYARRWRAISSAMSGLNEALADDLRGSGLEYNLARRDGSYAKDERIKREVDGLASQLSLMQSLCDLVNDPEMGRAAGYGRRAT